MKFVLIAFTFALVTFGQISKTPNPPKQARIPSIDAIAYPGQQIIMQPYRLAPGSIGSIRGSRLATTTATSVPGATKLGNVEVHWRIDYIRNNGFSKEGLFPDTLLTLLSVTPNEIRFVVPTPNLGTVPPDFSCIGFCDTFAHGTLALVVDGIRYQGIWGKGETEDWHFYAGATKGITPLLVTDTDIPTNVITDYNPIYQGQEIAVVVSDLKGATPTPLTFSNGLKMEPLTWFRLPIDVEGVVFDAILYRVPYCQTGERANQYTQYRAKITGDGVQFWELPFLVRPGDLDCKW